MKKFSHFFPMLVILGVLTAGCGPLDESTTSSAQQQSRHGRVKDSWIDVKEAAGVKLDDNLLRTNVYLIFDCSSSMAGEKIETAKTAINQFAKSLPEDTGLGLAIFDHQGLSERLPLGAKNRKLFYQIIKDAESGGGTPLSKAVTLGYEALRLQARRQLGYGEYHLVIVTDGEANPGYDPTDELNQVLSESPVVIHTIGFQIGERHSLNQPGRTIYKDAQSPKDLADGLQEVLSESDKF